MGKFEYESVAFKSPEPIDESDYISHKENLKKNAKENLYKNGVRFFSRHKITLIVSISCLLLGMTIEYFDLTPEWIGSLSYLIFFVTGLKFLFSFSSYVGYLSELRKFNRRFNKAIAKSENYDQFFSRFYSDKRYYEDV